MRTVGFEIPINDWNRFYKLSQKQGLTVPAVVKEELLQKCGLKASGVKGRPTRAKSRDMAFRTVAFRLTKEEWNKISRISKNFGISIASFGKRTLYEWGNKE